MISWDEFYAATVSRVKIITNESIEAAFKLFDLDGNGIIEISEFIERLPIDE